MAILNLKDLDVSYDKKVKVLENFNLDIEKGELVSLLGPSGCGKTTTLRVIAGFIEPVRGEFILNGKNLTRTPVHKRNFGMVFQSYALFPHLTVFDNVAFGLKMKKVPKEEMNERILSMLKIVDLDHLADRYPKELSGGQRQRVAISRALVIEPELLLLDEPLSNLDAKLRLKMRVEIKKLQRRMGITTVFVTHDQEECFSISDKVAVMNGGVIEQYDRPETIYSYPATEFVAQFVGFENFFDLQRVNDSQFQSESGSIFTIDTERKTKETPRGTIRPDDIKITTEESGENIIGGVIDIRTYLGKSYQYVIKTDLGTLVVNDQSQQIYQQGDKIKLHLPSNRIILI
jgi:putative spermidine/putrescine transport system ATP-binding protein